MLGILLIFLLTAASLALLFWVGGMFIQGYVYTQPSDYLHWQAPGSAIVIAGFLTLWCWLIVMSPEASPTNIPYDTVFRFSPEVDMMTEPPKELWVIRKKGEQVLYKRERVFDRLATGKYRYVDTTLARNGWGGSIEAVLIEHNGEKLRFAPQKTSEGDYRTFVADKGGWEFREYDDGPNRAPYAFRMGRFLLNLFLNATLFVLLFVCCWLVMRYSPDHAFLLSAGLWLLLALAILPMLFSYAAEQSVRRRSGSVTHDLPRSDIRTLAGRRETSSLNCGVLDG